MGQNADSSYEILFQNYRTIAYEAVNSGRFAQSSAEYDPTFGPLLPAERNAKILDIGCGMGNFLKYLEKKGYLDCEGVDVSQEQVDYCKKNVTRNVGLITDLSAFLTQRRLQWDCIVMMDVIEHLPRTNVIPILSAMFGALRKGGTVIISTGNLASFTGSYLRHIDFTHESGFTESSMRQVLRAVGFEDIAVTGTKIVIHSWRTYLLLGAQKFWHMILRLIYAVERGLDGVPRVLTNTLVAHARKSPNNSEMEHRLDC